MREIKFRVYDGEKMYDAMPIVDFKVHEINGVALMQYTGLKDKNGKEIYEGDICHNTNPPSQIQKKSLYGRVVYSYAAFGLELCKIETWEGYNDGVEPPTLLYFMSINLSQIEVIGNIY